MWSDKQPWWQKAAKEGKQRKQPPNPYAKSWCVIKIVGSVAYVNGQLTIVGVVYKPCPRLNAPQYYNPKTAKLERSIEVDNLTKHEAHAVAKGLNFLDGE